MPETIARSARRAHSQRPLSVVRTFAESADVTRAHAAQLLKETGNNNLWARVEKFIYACRAAGNEDMLWEKMGPLLDLCLNVIPETFGPRLLHEAVQADADEDVARSDWQAGSLSKEQYVRKLDRQIVRACALRDALAARGQ